MNVFFPAKECFNCLSEHKMYTELNRHSQLTSESPSTGHMSSTVCKTTNIYGDKYKLYIYINNYLLIIREMTRFVDKPSEIVSLSGKKLFLPEENEAVVDMFSVHR